VKETEVTSFDSLETPALLLDLETLERNIGRMSARLRELGVPLRPHVKTAKSIDVLRRVLEGQPGGVTVSTLKEAEYCLEHGIRDIVYAVGVAPGKLAHIGRLIHKGADLTVTLDSVEASRLVIQAASSAGVVIPVLIELDADGHRAGVDPQGPLLLEIARELARSPSVTLRGVLTHAGESYNCRSLSAMREMAELERAGAVLGAQRLFQAGRSASVVSVGSTPTATFAADLSGVTEVRAGVYMFQDLVMCGLGVCTPEDIALSVLVAVIGHQAEKGRLITDGGWMALSRDRGTSSQRLDQGYGVVCDAAGRPLVEDAIVASVNQEHGVIARRNDQALDLSRYPIGTLLRILPNHACATSAQHDAYQVVSGDPQQVVDVWPRFRGW
jgi:D-serine deaminase-like pyridoxal phosphate-dependent protein